MVEAETVEAIEAAKISEIEMTSAVEAKTVEAAEIAELETSGAIKAQVAEVTQISEFEAAKTARISEMQAASVESISAEAGGEIAELESAEVGTELGGIGTNGIIDGKTPAGRFADKVQGLPNSERPNTVAVVRTSDGRYYIGYNKAGVNNGEVQAIMDSLGNSNMYNRQCAEVNAISRAINKGANLEGATISVANVRSVGNYSGLHGTPKIPCDVCQPLLDFYGIKIVQ
ncbi:MAG: hypothetical protein IJ258_10185 [Methanobrevibacter sp.]|uniref:YwqJ-related putative deaminase n=1 Tax=Methanobrevibacter sp. TaxID=66852 RepID=UPI0025E9A1BD|nr:YwqJ-related putative deaminase [Methanobrevibacter sp.]MBQ8018453.1 hypothetical protein [Methanobrevibacter sp.]